jgi:hypothetical protein
MAQHTHEFDCRTCGAHLDSREDLDRHTAANHPESVRRSDVQSGTGSPADMRGSSTNPSDRRS